MDEVKRARLFMLELAKALIEEPSAQKMPALKEALHALAQGTGFPKLDQTLEDLLTFLEKTPFEEIEAEYYRFLIDPLAENPLPLTASHYLDGKSFGPSLAKLRELLSEVRVVKREEVKEPEDHLLCLLDFFFTLIEADKEKGFQERLLKDYLVPCVDGLLKEVEKKEAPYLLRVMAFLKAYFLLEERLLVEGL